MKAHAIFAQFLAGLSEKSYPENMGRGQGMQRVTLQRGAEDVLKHVRSLGLREAYTVGGYERDFLLGHQPKDIDIAVCGHTAEDLIQRAKKSGHVTPLIVAKQLIGVRLTSSWTPMGGIELALARTEVHEGGGRRAFAIKTSPDVTIEEDLARRDFTCNAIAQDIYTGRIVDPYGGRKDIINRVLRAVSERSFPEDPLRVLRGLVRVAKDGFWPDERTKEQMREWASDPWCEIRERALEILRKYVPEADAEFTERALANPSERIGDTKKWEVLDRESGEVKTLPATGQTLRELTTGYLWYADIPISPERVYDELGKILKGENAAHALELARETDILGLIIPEMRAAIGFDQHSPYHDLTIDEHSFLALKHACDIDAPLAVRWAALLHDLGKPEAAWGWLKTPNGEARSVGVETFLAAPEEERDEDILHFYARPDGQVSSHEEIGERLARDLFTKLHADSETSSRVCLLVREHMYSDDADFQSLSDSAQGRRARRFLKRVGRDAADDLLLLRRCDRRAKGRHVQGDWDAEISAFETVVHAQGNVPISTHDLAIDGYALMSLGFHGQDIGKAKLALLELVLEDPSLNNIEALVLHAAELKI